VPDWNSESSNLVPDSFCACTNCHVLRSDLEASAIEINDLKHKLDHASRCTILIPPCVACGFFKDKLFHATKEHTKLK
jgi:hypothetical protein